MVDAAGEPRAWSGPIENRHDQRRLSVDSMSEQQPRIEIDEALDQGWFEIWYQPKIDLRRKCLAGAEALARLRHPTLGVMPPGTFRPGIGEGSIARLTEYALVATLQNWRAFDDAGFNLSLAINVPVSVLLTLPIPALVEQYRPKSEAWPGIILEVTEDQIVRDLRLAHSIGTDLHVSGIKIAIDGFGAGYSSLSSLRELPFSELKIDRSFVRDCGTDATNAALCQTVIDLAHRFGSAAVADGVERQADLQTLIAMGCDFGQGPVIAPSMPHEEFLSLLLQRVSKGRSPTAHPSEPGAAIDRVA